MTEAVPHVPEPISPLQSAPPVEPTPTVEPAPLGEATAPVEPAGSTQLEPAQLQPMPWAVPAGPMPGSAVPFPVFVAAPPPARGNALTIVLAVVAGMLLLAAAGVGTFSYRDHTNSQQQIVDLQTRLDDSEQQLADTQSDLKRTQGELDDAQACADAVQAFWKLVQQVAGGSVTTTSANAATLAMLRTCGVPL